MEARFRFRDVRPSDVKLFPTPRTIIILCLSSFQASVGSYPNSKIEGTTWYSIGKSEEVVDRVTG